MNRAPSRGRLLFLIATVLVLLSVATQAAFASPVDDKRRKAAQIAAQIETNGDKISAMAESYNYTRIQLDNLRSSVAGAQSQLESAEIQNTEVRARVQKRALTMYSASNETDDLPVARVNEKRKDQYADIATGNDTSTIRQLQVTKETVSERKAELEKQLASISDQEKKLVDQKRALESANAAQQALLNQTKGEIATLIAQQQAARARVAATTATTPRKSSGASNQSLPTNLPAPSPKAAIAIEFARQQLGKPYRYAAVGPNSYDCSGLTMKAYAAAGLSMPHYSGAQYAMFPKVPESMLQPGDLVFRGPGGSQHVGLYIGNGLMIHAPQTGDVVKIAPIRNIIGGARPG